MNAGLRGFHRRQHMPYQQYFPGSGSVRRFLLRGLMCGVYGTSYGRPQLLHKGRKP